MVMSARVVGESLPPSMGRGGGWGITAEGSQGPTWGSKAAILFRCAHSNPVFLYFDLHTGILYFDLHTGILYFDVHTAFSHSPLQSLLV